MALVKMMTQRVPEKRVPPTSQLGVIQNAILEWLLTREQQIELNGTEKEKLVLAARGVPWNVALFCKSCRRACRADDYPDSSKISTSLKQLEMKKRLVERHGSRTSHVKLTGAGRRHAEAKRTDLRTWQEKKAVDRARYLAGNISYELSRYGDQMSGRQQYIETARQAYYLILLEELEQIMAHEKRTLAYTLSELGDSDFQRHLPVILQNPNLPPRHADEIKKLYEKLLKRDVYIYVD